jgi:plastocyanin
MHFRKAIALLSSFALVMLISGIAFNQRGALAQDEAPHPAHIHSGDCVNLGDVVFPLSDVSLAALVEGASVAGAVAGAADAIPVEISGTTVAASLADILAAPHAINIHESAENIGNYIACGTIGGTMIGTSDVAIGLGELNDSGYTGVATLHDNGDGTTAVSVYLINAAGGDTGMSAGGDMGTPEGGEDMSMAEGDEDAADEGGENAASEESAVMTGAAAVDIAGFAFNPPTLEVAVGDTVTWTNSDSAPHTVTQQPSGSGFQSGTLNQGASFSFTFEAPGTYDYFCEFHSGMTGQVIVS